MSISTGAYKSTADLPWSAKKHWTTQKTSALPLYKDLPVLHGIRIAWDAFGRGDEVGTVNFLTPDVVVAAAKEIKDGTVVSLNLPLQLPTHPSFGRKAVEHAIVMLPGYDIPVRDDLITTFNTQSGTQTDGLRHFGCIAGDCFYQGVPNSAISCGPIAIADPLAIQNKDIQIGIHTWAAHGVTGRGVLIDMLAYYRRDGGVLPYDPWTTHQVPLADIKAAAVHQGTTFLPGDNLMIRTGWTERYYNSTAEQKLKVAIGGTEAFAGTGNGDDVAEWIWDNRFASVSGDAPAFESWPPAAGQRYLHETLLAGFGCPIGEFFELEQLSEVCAAKKRYQFFYSSNLLNILGGAASTANASATF